MECFNSQNSADAVKITGGVVKICGGVVRILGCGCCPHCNSRKVGTYGKDMYMLQEELARKYSEIPLSERHHRYRITATTTSCLVLNS